MHSAVKSTNDVLEFVELFFNEEIVEMLQQHVVWVHTRY